MSHLIRKPTDWLFWDGEKEKPETNFPFRESAIKYVFLMELLKNERKIKRNGYNTYSTPSVYYGMSYGVCWVCVCILISKSNDKNGFSCAWRLGKSGNWSEERNCLRLHRCGKTLQIEFSTAYIYPIPSPSHTLFIIIIHRRIPYFRSISDKAETWSDFCPSIKTSNYIEGFHVIFIAFRISIFAMSKMHCLCAYSPLPSVAYVWQRQRITSAAQMMRHK